jgi:major membrane immunogen (membrane-anchored lipoprotein)
MTKEMTLQRRAFDANITSVGQYNNAMDVLKKTFLGFDDPLLELNVRLKELRRAFDSGAIGFKEWQKGSEQAKNKAFGLEPDKIEAFEKKYNELRARLFTPGTDGLNQSQFDEAVDKAKRDIGIEQGQGEKNNEYRTKVNDLNYVASIPGAITQGEYAATLKALSDKYLPQQQDTDYKPLSGASYGSKEALESLYRNKYGDKSDDTPKQSLQVQKQQLQVQQDTLLIQKQTQNTLSFLSIP